jgi:hypothetical protein
MSTGFNSNPLIQSLRKRGLTENNLPKVIPAFVLSMNRKDHTR